MTWVSLAIALLKVANSIITWCQQNQLIEQGRQDAIAEETTKILAMTTRGKAMLEKVNAMDEATVDAELRKLEPPARSG